MIVYPRHSPSPALPCPCLSWPTLPCPGPSWLGYYPKVTLYHPPPPSTLRVVVSLGGFRVCVFIFFLTLTSLTHFKYEDTLSDLARQLTRNIRQYINSIYLLAKFPSLGIIHKTLHLNPELTLCPTKYNLQSSRP